MADRVAVMTHRSIPTIVLLAAALLLAAIGGAAAQTVTASPKPPTAGECIELFTRHPELAKPRPRSGIYGEETIVPGTPEAMAEACHALAAGQDDRTGSVNDVPGPGSLQRDQPNLSETMAPALNPKMRALQQLRTADRINRQATQIAKRGDWTTALRLFQYAAQYAPHDTAIQRNIIEARRQVARQAEQRRLQQRIQ
ncbi:MAG: hypothetical protein GEU92_14995 [Alphaproteobacteria bacterium]|nr:hypothetical protein [Alphaproteobacteria bacterium]